jgi:hypothetical protein
VTAPTCSSQKLTKAHKSSQMLPSFLQLAYDGRGARTPSLISLKLNLTPLRPNNKYSIEKNNRMMDRLCKLNWYVAFREELARHRKSGGPTPHFPSDAVDAVERLVDEELSNEFADYVGPKHN